MNKELADLGNALRQVRKAKKISQMHFAELCGVHRTYICDVERGNRNVTFLTLVKLARGLDTTVSEIIRQTEPSFLATMYTKPNGALARTAPNAASGERRNYRVPHDRVHIRSAT
jgi:transcriptional regulator with XRE-family HTH domain